MKTNLIKTLVLLLVLIPSFLSCSKDDSDSPPIDSNGGAIKGGQVVTITLDNLNLDQYEYFGTIGDLAITLVKTSDHTLAFYMPNNAIFGDQDLVIPSLSNTLIKFKISKTVITGSVDENVTDFFTNLNSFKSTLGTSPEETSVTNAINTLLTFYNNASEADKLEIAILYAANKQTFDNLILTDFSDITGRDNIVSDTQVFIGKHIASVKLLAVGAVVVVAGVALSAPAVAVVGCGLVAIGGYKAYKANVDALNNVYDKTAIIISGWFSNNKSNLAVIPDIILTDNTEQQLSFNVRERKLIASDESKTTDLAVKYFNSVNLYNHYVDENNPLITETNATSGTSYDALNYEVLPVNSPNLINTVSNDIMANTEFSLSNTSLTIVSTTLSTEGELKLKIKINGSPTALPIVDNLKISYNDGFSSFIGEIPIKVQPSLIGTWNLVSFENTTAVGQYLNLYNSNCPDVAYAKYTITDEVLNISNNTYNYVENESYTYYNFSINIPACTTFNDQPDTTETYSNSANGTYLINGNTFTATENNITQTSSYYFINSNKLQIGNKVYTRQ